jgi:hypothetical protein
MGERKFRISNRRWEKQIVGIVIKDGKNKWLGG